MPAGVPGGAGWQEPATPAAGASAAAAAPADAAKDASTGSAQDASRKKLDKPEDVDPLKRPLSDKQRFNRQKQLKQELSTTYKTWLNEDVGLDYFG